MRPKSYHIPTIRANCFQFIFVHGGPHEPRVRGTAWIFISQLEVERDVVLGIEVQLKESSHKDIYELDDVMSWK